MRRGRRDWPSAVKRETPLDTKPEETPPPFVLLIIDDRETERSRLRTLFDQPGHRILEAADGATGLTLAHAERPDCVLLDLDPAGLGGFDVLGGLQRDPRTREIPVIGLVDDDERLEDVQRALEGGAVDVIVRGAPARHLTVRVRGAIARRRGLHEVQELRGAFTSMLVHDLRVPLTTMLAYADLLEQAVTAAPGGVAGRYLSRMRESCSQMLQLTDEILKLSSLEASRLAINLRPMDLTALTTGVVDRIEPAARSMGIALELCAADHPMAIVGDTGRLDQVLMNLVGNALKFTPEGGRIVVTLAERAGEAEVTVADTGPGIPPEEMMLLFEKFRQASLGRTSRHAGSGLGLVICRHLVEAHGGSIHAESPPGEGARFVFRLPLRSDDTTAAPRAARLKSILIVDDDVLTRGALAVMLRADGHATDVAATAREALQKIEEHAYDMILCDIQMPDLDGLGLYAELQRRHPEVCRRIIFITGHGLGSRVAAFLEATAARWLQKPIPLDRIQGILGDAAGEAS